VRGLGASPRSAAPDPALAATLRRLRGGRALTLEELAFRSGITACALARIELAQAVPGWNTVRRIAAALDVNMVELCVAVEGALPPAPAPSYRGEQDPTRTAT
jgi:transcriptional regulator with XRE-family HTH domain